MTHPLRKLGPFDVRVIRKDYAKRRHALRVKQEADAILRTVPTLKDHAARLGMSDCQIRRIAKGIVYKEVR